MPLLRNTAVGFDTSKLIMVLNDTGNGAFQDDGVLQVNPVLAYK